MEQNLTEKTRAAISEAQGLALDRQHAQIEPEHVLAALLAQADGLVPQIVRRVGAEPSALISRLEAAISSFPVTSADTELRAGTRFARMMREAGRIMEARGDKYLSVEHLLLALTIDKGEAGRILNEAGAGGEAV
jgi:ATP-dependent Clp protease ATP-binding subunit ClpB